MKHKFYKLYVICKTHSILHRILNMITLFSFQILFIINLFSLCKNKHLLSVIQIGKSDDDL